MINLFAKLGDRLHVLPMERAPFLKSLAELFALQEPLSTITITDNDLPPKFRLKSPPMTPDTLYTCLRAKSRSSAFRGAQEDAQEFLTFMLDEMHEEFIGNKQGLNWSLTTGHASQTSASASASASDNNNDNNDSLEWIEVNRKNKVSISRTMELTDSPISLLFYGKFKSIVRRARQKDSITLEPFHCLSLDIQDASVVSIESGLEALVAPEVIISEGIQKRILIDKAPPLLVIQLKRFIYDPDQGVGKISKFVSYPLRLTLPPTVLSAPTTSSYLLTAICYHHGRSAQGGHYTAHVRQSANDADPWLYFDDGSVSIEPVNEVLKEQSHWRNAYLLFYCKSRSPPIQNR